VNSASLLSAKFKKLRQALKRWSKQLSNLNMLISNCNTVILFLDTLEESRGLFNTESNLRKIIKVQIGKLLHFKNIYWRQRYTENKIRFGDECTKFFHAMATISYRRNSISQLLNSEGAVITDHAGKADMIWHAFRGRMGITTNPTMLFDLHNLIAHHDDLSALAEPFQQAEIDGIIQKMPPDKTPGPDGFNGHFLKKCWHLVKDDFYRLCVDFFAGCGNLECINDSFIALVPKKINPEGVNDYRPISLLNCSIKVLTKLLADRLQCKILQLVHKNQYGFIKSRSIQDCLAWCFEYIHQCKQSRREAIILKLDFEKAFDTVEHTAIIQVLQHMSFPDRWISWVKAILSSGTSSVILNGVAGRKFKCKRGVRQGDPLSPLIFVLAAELLQVVVNKAASQGLLQPPIPHHDGDYPIVQYADDTLLIMQVDARQIFFLKALLNSFSESTGLKVNHSKSLMLPINVSLERMEILASTFGCQIGSLPFTYLGLPMGTTKPRVDDYAPLMDRIERRLTSCSSLLSSSGRLQLVQSVITSTATYAMCTLKLPKGVIDNIDRARKQCLWRGSDRSKKGGNLAAWPMVTKPKNKGGLNVTNLYVQNDALLIKHLHKFYNKVDVPWVKLVWNAYYEGKVPHATREMGSFWWRDIQRLSTLFRGIARCIIGDGTSVSFWEDLWSVGVLSFRYPRLYSHAHDAGISVNEIISAPDLDSLFMLPLTQEAFGELQELRQELQNQEFDLQHSDIWTYQWGSNNYSSKKFYKLVFQNIPAHPVYSWMWKSKVTPRVKFFAWQVLVDRLNTKVMLRRRNLFNEPNAHCVLCAAGIDEDIDHLLFDCSFSRRCWGRIGIQWDINLSLHARIAHCMQQQNVPYFMEIITIAAWEIWKIRNDKIFRNGRAHVNIWFSNFKSQCLLQSLRFKPDLRSGFCFWLDAFS
jgi:hypothetical protein